MPAAPASRPLSIRAARWTYGQLADRVARFGAALRGLGVRREERVLIALLDTIDWPTAFLGCLKAGVVAVPVNTLLTEDDYRFMLADSRARCLVVSEALFPRFEKLIGKAPTSSTSSSPATIRTAIGCSRMSSAPTSRSPTPRRPPATTSRSGSTPRARPASRRARCMCTPILKLTDDLYGTPFARHQRKRRLLLGGETVLRLWARQRADVPDVGRRDDGAAAGPADAGRRRGACCASIRSRCSTRCRHSMPRFSPARTRRSARGETPPLRLGRRGAAGRRRPALERALRRRHSRRPRLDRDAAHLPLQPRRARRNTAPPANRCPATTSG